MSIQSSLNFLSNEERLAMNKKKRFSSLKLIMSVSTIVAVSGLALPLVAGETWSTYGDHTYGSDGTSYSSYGNTDYGSDGTSYSNYGNSSYGSDGSSLHCYGNHCYGN